MELVTLQQSAAVATSNGAATNEQHEALTRIKELEESLATKEHHYKSEVSFVNILSSILTSILF